MIGEMVNDELAEECFECIRSVDTSPIQKKSAREILVLKYGKMKTNDLLEGLAIVHERNDSLVVRWTKAVKRRDKACVNCNSTTHLCAHHISHWVDDPVNRINVENGITLCSSCHAKQHPELSRKLFGGV